MQTRPNSIKSINRKNGRFLKRKRDEEGVASTVGTIMALLVFLTFLTLFTNSYVPIWMTDNEHNHMNQAIDQFGNLKGKVDDLVIRANMTGHTDFNMYAPITLGASGIPVFASPTAGALIYSPYGMGNSSVEIESPILNDLSGGMVQLYAPNRYYVQQWIAYENGAIIVKQLDGQIIRGAPSLEVQKPSELPGSRLIVSWTQIVLIGTNSTVAGTSSAGINIDMIYLDSQSYSAENGTDVKMIFRTLYGVAWYDYLTSYLGGVANIGESDYWVTHDSSYDTITVQLNNTGSFDYNKAIMQMTVSLA